MNARLRIPACAGLRERRSLSASAVTLIGGMPDETEHLDLSVTLGGGSFTATGPADRVIAALERFSELVAEHGAAPPPSPVVAEPPRDGGGPETQDEPEAAATPPQESAASKVPLPKFLERPSIQGNSKIATASVVWAADHEQKTLLRRVRSRSTGRARG